MTDKMTLVVVKKTGHVLAFVTRASEPEAKLEPEAIAGKELLVRFAGDPADPPFRSAQFLVPADQLGVEVKDYDAVVVTRPRDYFLNEQQQVVNAAAAAPAVGVTGNTRIGVTVAPNVISKTPVWIQVASATDPANTQVREAEIAINQNSVDLDVLPLDSGDHFVLALVAGRQQIVAEINIP